MNDIINIVDPRITCIPIHESGEALIDLKDQSVIAFGPPPEVPETITCYTKIRRSVYDRLCSAQTLLRNGWKFRVYEGLRSRSVQTLLFESEYEKVKTKFPKLNQESLFYRTTQLISPVFNFDGSVNIAAHETGGAVDVEIIDAQGSLVDMGMALIDWRIVEPEICLTDCPHISDVARANREILKRVMTEVGFINYPTEWWHYSYGDRYWAYFTGNSAAIYGSADELAAFHRQDK